MIEKKLPGTKQIPILLNYVPPVSTIRHLRTGTLELTYWCWASCRTILNMMFRFKW